MVDEIQIEEMLEHIWVLEEGYGKAERVRLDEKFTNEIVEKYLKEMSEKKLIELDNDRIAMTGTGRNEQGLLSGAIVLPKGC